MISPAWRIRDAVEQDMPIINQLFASQDFPDAPGPEGVRVAADLDNVIFGAIRIEIAPDGSANINPVVVFEVKQGIGVGAALVKDALKRYPDLRLVARGPSVGFYEALGFERCGWDDIDPKYERDCDLCPILETCEPVPFKSAPEHFEFTFLGTSSGCGVPAFFCHCKACEAARKDPTLRRGCTGALVRGHHTVLLDSPPDVRHQLIREGVDFIDEFFLTHAHYDHLGGFGELEYYVRLYLGGLLPFHASEHALTEARQEFFYMDDCFVTDAIEDFGVRTVGQLQIQALPLVHAPGTFGYLITTPNGTRTFYAPDTSTLRDDVVEILRGVDNLIMDATYWGEGNLGKHHTVQQTIDEGLNLLDAGHVYLTHLAPHICTPETDVIAEIAEHVKRYEGRVVMACDGMKIDLGQ